MQEVIKKIQELYTLMESKNRDIDAQFASIAERKACLEEVGRKQTAAGVNLAARERLVQKGEALNLGIKKLEEDTAKLSREKSLLAERVAENLKKQVSLDKAIKEANDAKELFVKKRDAVDKEKEAIENERKVRAKLMEEIKRNF